MTDLTAILNERKSQHGDFTIHAALAQALKQAACTDLGNYSGLPPIHREAIDMILHKIARILAGNPNHEDHWRDIAGYATLVADRIK